MAHKNPKSAPLTCPEIKLLDPLIDHYKKMLRLSLSDQMIEEWKVSWTQHYEDLDHDLNQPATENIQHSALLNLISFFKFTQKMLLRTADSQYSNGMEHLLYNTFLKVITGSNVEQFVKSPPLFMTVSNFIRALGNYAYSKSQNTFYVHLFMSSKITTYLSQRPVSLHISTDYPDQETTRILIECPPRSYFTLAIRIPAWCRNCRILINQLPKDGMMRNGYTYIHRFWNTGDVLEIVFEMIVEISEMDTNTQALSIHRGPLNYSLDTNTCLDINGSLYLRPHCTFTETNVVPEHGSYISLTCDGSIYTAGSWVTRKLTFIPAYLQPDTDLTVPTIKYFQNSFENT